MGGCVCVWGGGAQTPSPPLRRTGMPLLPCRCDATCVPPPLPPHPTPRSLARLTEGPQRSGSFGGALDSRPGTMEFNEDDFLTADDDILEGS